MQPGPPLTVLGANGAAVVEGIVARKKAARGWAPHVTADWLMREWSRLVRAIEQGTYPKHMMVEEYANDLDARRLLQTVIAVARESDRVVLLREQDGERARATLDRSAAALLERDLSADGLLVARRRVCARGTSRAHLSGRRARPSGVADRARRGKLAEVPER